MTLSGEIFQVLAKAIVSGELEPGQKLDEPSICRRFSVSRTPVREALRQLSGEGLVEIRPQKGVIVRQVDVERLTDMFDALGEFEALCARLCAERMTPLERRRLQVFNENIGRATNGKDAPLSDLNEQFHELIYQGAHNESIAAVTRNFRQRVAPFQVLQFAPSESSDTFYDHDVITKAIVAADKVTAQRVMHDHITRSSLQVIDHFVQRTAQGAGKNNNASPPRPRASAAKRAASRRRSARN